MEWACGEKRVPVVGDPACPRRSEDELVDPTCSDLWSPLAQSRAQWGCWQDKWDSMCFTPLGLVTPDQNLRTCFVARSLPRTFSSSNQCHGFVHLEEWGFSRVLASSRGWESGQWRSAGFAV